MTCPAGTRNLAGALAMPRCPCSTAEPTRTSAIAAMTRVRSRMIPPGFCLSAGLAPASPAPMIRSPLDSLQTDAIITRVPVGRRPDAYPIALAESTFADAITLEPRHAGPLSRIDLRPAKGIFSLDVDPRVRILVLHLEDLTLDLDGVILDVVLRERMMPHERSRQAHDSGDHQRPQLPCHLIVLPWRVPTGLLSSSSDPGWARAPARGYRNPAATVRYFRSASQSMDSPAVPAPAH